MTIRERQCNAFVGAPGRGKSSTLNEVLAHSGEKNIIILKHPYNLDDKALKNYPVVAFEKYVSGRAKVPCMEDNYKAYITAIFKNYRNGALVIDDAQLYERDVVSKTLNDLVIMRRHLGIDVYLIYHGCTTLPIQLFPFMNNLFLWHTADNFDYKAKKLPNYQKLINAKARITEIASGAEPGTKEYYYCERIKLS